MEKLQQFLTYINEFHPTIKFDYTYSHKYVNLLNTTIYLNSLNKLNQIHILKLRTEHFSTQLFPPPFLQKHYNILLRYRCIIANNKKLQRLNKLLIALIHRGYKHDNITTAFNKALQYTTQKELFYNEKKYKTNNNPIFTIPYYFNTKYIAHIACKHWTIIENEPTLRVLRSKPPMLAYQRNKNLRDKLVSAKLTIAHPNSNNQHNFIGEWQTYKPTLPPIPST